MKVKVCKAGLCACGGGGGVKDGDGDNPPTLLKTDGCLDLALVLATSSGYGKWSIGDRERGCSAAVGVSYWARL
jgi:hypothetical protein